MTWEEFWNNLVNGCVNVAWKLLAAVLVLVVGSFLIRFFMKHFLVGKRSEKLDPTVKSYVRTFVKAGLNVLMIVMVIGILGVPMASVVTVIAAAGAAIALALQGSLSNLASGIMLLIFHPFKIGQYIEADGQGGTVEEIGLFYTGLVTPDNKHVVIPNGTLTSSVITNYSVEKTRRVEVTCSVAYGTDVEKVKEVILALAASHDKVAKDPAPFLRMTEMADSSINFTLRVWCKNADFWGVKFDLTEGIYKELNRAGIEIPFPQVDVHVKNQ